MMKNRHNSKKNSFVVNNKFTKGVKSTLPKSNDPLNIVNESRDQ